MAATTAMLVPAVTPPPGVISNFEDPPSKAHIIHIVMSVCLGLVTLLVAVRIYTRACISKPLWWDDLASLLAWVFFIALVGVTFGAVENGGGVDAWNVSKQTYKQYNMYWRYIMIMARVDITLAKVAILLLFLRLFVPRQTGSRQMWFWIWSMIIFNVVYCVVLILLVQLQCIRRKTPPPNGSCLNQQVLIISASAINVITEVAILIVAVLGVWGLRMPARRKLAIIALLSFGSAGIAFSATRLIWQTLTTNTNPTVYNMTVVMLAYGSHLPPALLLFLWAYNALPEMPDIPFSTAETTVAIMAGCLPLVSSFYKFHVERHVSQITVSLTGTRSRESKERQARKPHHPLSISTTELVSTDVALEEFRRA